MRKNSRKRVSYNQFFVTLKSSAHPQYTARVLWTMDIYCSFSINSLLVIVTLVRHLVANVNNNECHE